MKTITVEKRKNGEHIIGQEWTRDYTHATLDFLNELDEEFVDAEELKAVENKEIGNYFLENGDFAYYVEIKKGTA